MKLNKKMLAVNLLATLLISDGAMAGFKAERSPNTGKGSPSSSGSGGDSMPTKISTATKESSQKIIAATEVSCNSDQNAAKYFPLSMFQELTRDGSNLEFEVRSNNKVVVKVPPIYNGCGEFIPEMRQNKESKNISVLMKLVSKDNRELTYQEFELCLKNNGVLKEENGKKKLNIEAQEGKMFSESVYSMDFDFDKKKDIKKTVTVNFAYPKEYKDPKNGFDPLFGKDDKGSVSGEACMDAELIAEKPVYVNKGQAVLIEEINAECKTGTASRIAEIRRSIGNADALKDIADQIRAELDVAYMQKAKQELTKDLADMTRIENNLMKIQDEGKARKLMEEYAEILKRVDKNYLNPSISQLKSLMAEREKLEDSDSPTAEKDIQKLDVEIKKLNADIRVPYMRPVPQMNNLYDVFQKFALTEPAKAIDDIRQKANIYANTYPGKKRSGEKDQFTLEQASSAQEKRALMFDKKMVDFSDIYEAAHGSMAPITKTTKEAEMVAKRMNDRMATLQKKYYSDLQSYCATGMLGSVKNPVKCTETQTNFPKQYQAELKKRTKDIEFINGRKQKLDKLGAGYNEHTRKVAAKESSDGDSYDPMASSFSDYEDNFSDRFPGYYGPSISTSYNPAAYNIGQQMQMPQMMQQQQQMMPQMQMQQPMQQQTGGWPSF